MSNHLDTNYSRVHELFGMLAVISVGVMDCLLELGHDFVQKHSSFLDSQEHLLCSEVHSQLKTKVKSERLVTMREGSVIFRVSSFSWRAISIGVWFC